MWPHTFGCVWSAQALLALPSTGFLRQAQDRQDKAEAKLLEVLNPSVITYKHLKTRKSSLWPEVGLLDSRVLPKINPGVQPARIEQICKALLPFEYDSVSHLRKGSSVRHREWQRACPRFVRDRALFQGREFPLAHHL